MSTPASSEIWIVEPIWEGFLHSPFNASLVEIVARGWPNRGISFAAESGHIAEVRSQLPREIDEAIRYIPFGEEPLADAWAPYRHDVRRHLHPLSQARRAYRLLRAIDAMGQPDREWIFASEDASVLNALGLHRRWRGVRRRVEVVTHGELGSLTGPRPKRADRRGLDLTSALQRWTRHGGSITVLEHHIEEALTEMFPWLAGPDTVKVLPHPCASGDGAELEERVPGSPLQVGFLGVATKAKGIEVFVSIAERLQEVEDVRFRMAGLKVEDSPELRYDLLEDPISMTAMPRPRFEQIVRELDYVCLPLAGGHYRFVASGTVLDAIQYLRPLIAFDTGPMRALFASAGDIGHLCADEEDMVARIHRLATEPDPVLYKAQVENLRHLRSRRTAVALTKTAQEIWLT